MKMYLLHQYEGDKSNTELNFETFSKCEPPTLTPLYTNLDSIADLAFNQIMCFGQSQDTKNLHYRYGQDGNFLLP